MTDIRFSVSKDTLEKMKKYPEIIWEKVAQGAIDKYIDKLELTERLTSRSNFTIEDADDLGY